MGLKMAAWAEAVRPLHLWRLAYQVGFGYFREKQKKMKEITVQELKDMRDRGEDFQLIDVREPFEYEVSNLDGLNIPLVGIAVESDKIARDRPVVVQCRSGKRSAQVILLLEREGFGNLANLTGGILAWKEEFDPEMEVY